MNLFAPLVTAISLCSAAPISAGSAEEVLTACSGAEITVEAVEAALIGRDWRTVTVDDEVAFHAVLDEGMLLMQTERNLSPATLADTQVQMTRLVAQLDGGITKGTLPGARLFKTDGSAALVVEDPTEHIQSVQCYFAGPADDRFSRLLDQMREYHLLTYDHDYIERGPLDTTTNTTRSSSVISRFKPEAADLSLGKTAPLAIYILTRRTENG